MHLFDTKKKEKVLFTPQDPEAVSLYLCGPTVYDLPHVGNARPMVVFDVLFRLLRRTYGEKHVTYVRNITDVDDKIIARATEEKRSEQELTEELTQEFSQDMKALGVLPPTFEPRASQHIGRMQTMISALLEKGFAYEAEGHVLFSVEKFPDYGKLSKRNPDEMIAGARVEVAPYKKDPQDFVLWKPASSEKLGWESPWGRGRPGWHIECSAMSKAYLGETLDIHAGGQDLVFPHHENEIAQSECYHGGTPFVRYWLHNGHVLLNGTKMSKSLGNTLTVRELLEKGVPGEAIRLALLSAKYGQPLDMTIDRIEAAEEKLDAFYQVLRDVPPAPNQNVSPLVIGALEDNLNFPKVLAALHAICRELQETGDRDCAGTLQASGALLGLLESPPDAWFAQKRGEDVEERVPEKWVYAQLDLRTTARKEKDWEKADSIRKELEKQGVIITDTPEGSNYRIRGGRRTLA